MYACVYIQPVETIETFDTRWYKGRSSMKHTLKGRRWLMLVAVIGLIAASCGSDATETATDTESTEEAESTESEAEADGEEGEAMEEESEADSEPEAAGPSFYEGETLEILIPFGEGGGADTWGRALVPFFEQYLGDDVRVVAFNDGGKVNAISTYEQATAHDGLTVFVSSGSISIPFLLDREGVAYDYADFRAVIGSPVGGAVYVRSDTGITAAEDLCTATGLNMATKDVTGLDVVPVLALDLLGTEFEIEDGAEGAGPIRNFFEQGLFNLSYDTSAAKAPVEELVAAGDATLMFSFGIVNPDGTLDRDPAFPDLPTVAEVYETCNGEAPSGEAWDAYLAVNTAGFAAQKNIWIHGDAPPEAIDALIAAAEQIVVDEEFLSIATDLIGAYEFSYGDDLEAQFNAASQLPPEAKTFLCEFLQNEYGAIGICGG